MSSSISLKPRRSLVEDTVTLSKKEWIRADGLNSKEAVWSEALEVTKQGFWVDRKKKERKEMQEYWGVAILFRVS